MDKVLLSVLEQVAAFFFLAPYLHYYSNIGWASEGIM